VTDARLAVEHVRLLAGLNEGEREERRSEALNRRAAERRRPTGGRGANGRDARARSLFASDRHRGADSNVMPGGTRSASSHQPKQFEVRVDLPAHEFRACCKRRLNSAAQGRYGRIRGSDGIFSFHPFALESISGNGYGSAVRMRSELEVAGVIARYDRSRHPRSVYNAAEGLRE